MYLCIFILRICARRRRSERSVFSYEVARGPVPVAKLESLESRSAREKG